VSYFGMMDAFCQASTSFMSCWEAYIVVCLPVRSVSLLLDIGFQKQSRIFFHPVTNDASTGQFQELNLHYLGFASA